MKKTLKILIILADILLIAFFAVMKIQYYSESGLGASPALALSWSALSMLITLLPMLTQIAFLLFYKDERYDAAFFVPLFLWLGEYVFEFTSLLGSAVCLDKRWTGMAERMMSCFLFFLIPLVLSLILHLCAKKKVPERA